MAGPSSISTALLSKYNYSIYEIFSMLYIDISLNMSNSHLFAEMAHNQLAIRNLDGTDRYFIELFVPHNVTTTANAAPPTTTTTIIREAPTTKTM